MTDHYREWLIGKVLDLWAAGASTDQIAARLDISRSTVAGLIHRARGRGDERATRRLVAEPEEMVRVAPLPVPIAPAAAGRYCLFPLWPNGARPGREPLFCGAPRDTTRRTSYCATHAVLCTQRPAKAEAA